MALLYSPFHSHTNPLLQTMFHDITTEELQANLAEREADYGRLRFEHAIAPLPNPNELRAARHEIARIQTEIRARELATFTPAQLAKRDRIRFRRSKIRKNK